MIRVETTSSHARVQHPLHQELYELVDRHSTVVLEPGGYHREQPREVEAFDHALLAGRERSCGAQVCFDEGPDQLLEPRLEMGVSIVSEELGYHAVPLIFLRQLENEPHIGLDVEASVFDQAFLNEHGERVENLLLYAFEDVMHVSVIEVERASIVSCAVGDFLDGYPRKGFLEIETPEGLLQIASGLGGDFRLFVGHGPPRRTDAARLPFNNWETIVH